jgi:hypothetical protein
MFSLELQESLALSLLQGQRVHEWQQAVQL